MSKTLTLEFSDEIYQTLEKVAADSGRTLEETALEWRLRHIAPARSHRRGQVDEVAQQRFERHFGAWDSGDSHSADNERIDDDLARVYGGH